MKPPSKLTIKNNFSNNLKRKKMTMDPAILDPTTKLKSQSIGQYKRGSFLKNKGKLIKKIAHNKNERTIINDKYRRHEEMLMSSLTPFVEKVHTNKDGFYVRKLDIISLK